MFFKVFISDFKTNYQWFKKVIYTLTLSNFIILYLSSPEGCIFLVIKIFLLLGSLTFSFREILPG